MNKSQVKVFLIIAILIATGFLAWNLIFRGKDDANSLSKRQADLKRQNELLNSIKGNCSFANNGETIKRAMEDKNMAFCDCIEESDAKKLCKTNVLDVSYYRQALDQFDASLCDQISNEESKKSCKFSVENSVNKFSKEDPDFLARVYGQTNNYNGVISIYEERIKNDPQNLEAILALALAYANKGLNEHKESEYTVKAFDLISQAEKLDARNPEVYRVKGFIYEVKPDLGMAITSYNKALEIDANYVLAYLGRGHANNVLGALEKALEDFKKAASLDSSRQVTAIYSNLCRLESTRDDLMEDAIANCKIVAEGKGNSVISKLEAHQILADMFMRLKRFDEALTQLQIAQSYSANDANLYVSFSKLYILREDFVQAENYARKALSIDEMKTSAYDALAYSLYRQGKNSDAIQMALKGVEVIDRDVSLLNPSKPIAKKNLYYILANIYHITGDKNNETKYKDLGDNIKTN